MIGADRQRFGPPCVLLKRVPHGQTESGGIGLAANAGPRVPSGGVTHKRRCTYRPSVIYLIVNKLLSLSLSLSLLIVILQGHSAAFAGRGDKTPLDGQKASFERLCPNHARRPLNTLRM